MSKIIRGDILSLLICIFLTFTNLFAQQRNIEDITVENAAVCYLRAFELMHYPNTGEVIEKIRRVVKNGWQEDKELEKILNQNEMCFKEFKKGVLLKKCDFDFGKKYKYLIQKQPPPFLKIRNLSNLLLLKGRYLERKGDFDEAIDLYLSLLTFALHISQDNSILSHLIALRIEKNVYAILKDYLNSQKATKRNALKILNYLEDYKKQHFFIAQVLEKEKEFFISSLQMVVDDINTEQKFNIEERKKALEFGDEILKQGHLLADYYYGLLVKAVKTNNEADWDAVSREIQSLQKEVESIGISWGMVGDIVRKKQKELNKKLAHQIVKVVLFISFPNIEKVKKEVNSYYLTLEELKELRSLAGMKAR